MEVSRHMGEGAAGTSSQGYSAKEVASVLGIPAERVRSLVSAGWVRPSRGPRGEYRFSFSDLAILRRAKRLEEKIPARKVRRALRNLRKQDAQEQPLGSRAVVPFGKAVLVRDDSGQWMTESGQGVFSFDEGQERAPVQSIAGPDQRRPMQAREWYSLAAEWEQSKPAQAQEAYRRALAIDSSLAEAHINLGRLLHESGNLSAAAQHYRFAAELRPTDAIAAFNLGVALQDLGRLREALAAYQRAVAIDPACADAHYNAARVCERLGDRAAAIRHLKACRSLRANG